MKNRVSAAIEKSANILCTTHEEYFSTGAALCKAGLEPLNLAHTAQLPAWIGILGKQGKFTDMEYDTEVESGLEDTMKASELLYEDEQRNTDTATT